ncbi:MAG TPA: hypothetical protein EYP08_05160 [Pyrodictiaceae archaeon]|nr:hypothetical protein [Pyrodictiaceae archaeon]
MPGVETFVKAWLPNNKPGFTEKLKDKFGTHQPIKYKLTIALYKLKTQTNKLDYMIAKMKERDAQLFEKVVQAQMEKDSTRAAMYAAEVAEIRKLVKALMTARLALERVALRLETIMAMGDALVGIAPVVGVIKDLRKYLLGIVPEIGLELTEIGELLEGIVTETGELTGAFPAPAVYSEEARKILEEAAAIAEQRLKAEFPELPSTVPSGEKQAQK